MPPNQKASTISVSVSSVGKLNGPARTDAPAYTPQRTGAQGEVRAPRISTSSRRASMALAPSKAANGLGTDEHSALLLSRQLSLLRQRNFNSRASCSALLSPTAQRLQPLNAPNHEQPDLLVPQIPSSPSPASSRRSSAPGKPPIKPVR